jgi:hypothetical protein
MDDRLLMRLWLMALSSIWNRYPMNTGGWDRRRVASGKVTRERSLPCDDVPA